MNQSEGLSLNYVADRCLEITLSKGFDLTKPCLQVLLVGTELMEALEHVVLAVDDPLSSISSIFCRSMTLLQRIREQRVISDASIITNASEFDHELLDAVYRLFSYLRYRGVDIEAGLRELQQQNEARPFRHGKRD